VTAKKDKSPDDLLAEVNELEAGDPAIGTPSDPVVQDAEKAAASADLPETPADGLSDDLDLDDDETGATELEISEDEPYGPRVHIVTGGQTLRQIAGHYGVEYGTLLKLNPQLKNPRHLVKGQEIKIDG
jgi:LysM repeat protein